MSAPARPVPVPDDASAAYWDAAAYHHAVSKRSLIWLARLLAHAKVVPSCLALAMLARS